MIVIWTQGEVFSNQYECLVGGIGNNVVEFTITNNYELNLLFFFCGFRVKPLEPTKNKQ